MARRTGTWPGSISPEFPAMAEGMAYCWSEGLPEGGGAGLSSGDGAFAQGLAAWISAARARHCG